MLVEAWDGRNWDLAGAPAVPTSPFGIAASAASNQWAVGFRDVAGATKPCALPLRLIGPHGGPELAVPAPDQAESARLQPRRAG
jgi:hypothetical protein